MPIDARQAKNNANLNSQTPQAYIPDVAVDTLRNVRGEGQDPEQLQRALNDIGGFFAEKGQKEKEKADFAAKQRGIADAEQDKVSSDMFAASQAYREAVNSTQGQREALQWFNQKKVELEKLQRENPNMDFEEWRKGAISDLFSTPNSDPHALAAKNQMAGALEQNLRSGFAATQAKMEHDQAEKEFVGKNLALLDAGANISGKDIDSMLATAKPLGLSDQEARMALGKALGARIEQGHPEVFEALTQADSKLHLDGDVGVHLQEAYRIGQARKKQLDEEANLVHGTELFQTMTTATRQAMTGSFGMTQANALKGMLKDEQIVGLLDHSLRVNEENAKKAAAQGDAVKAEQQMTQMLTSGKPISAFFGYNTADGKPVTPERLQASYDRMAQDSYWNLRKAVEAGDPHAVAAAVQQQAGILDIGVKHTLIPQALKWNLEKSTTTNPQDFVANARVYQQLKQANLGGYLTGTMSPDIRAKFDHFLDMTGQGGGMTEQQALEMLDKANVSPKEAQERVSAMRKSLDEAVKTSISGGNYGSWFSPFDKSDGFGSELIRKQIEAYATADVMATGRDASAAIGAAQKRFAEDYDIIGGVPINKAKMQLSPDFASHFKDYEQSVLLPKLEETYGKDAHSMTFTIAPVQNEAGKFYVIPTNVGSSVPMQDPKSGEFIKFSQAEMMEQTTKVKQQQEQQRQKNIDAFDTDPSLPPLT